MPGRGPNTEKGGDWDTLFRLGTFNGWSDGQLLARFLDRKEEGGDSAFDALVKRHGPMVWRTCRGSLADRHAAEDAFQATFLVLAERAGSIRNRDSIAGWLYGVARKIATRMRSNAARRPAFEARAARPEAVPSPLDDRSPIDREALLREVDRLPSHYRGAIVLHDLGGFSYEEAAERLGCPIGTVKARLHRARALLRSRLEARGAGGFSPSIGLGIPASIVPNPLAARTVRSAVSLLIGRSATGAIPPAVAASTRWMLNAMIIAQYKAAASAVVVGVLLCAGGAAAVVASQGLTAADPPPPPTLAARPPAPAPVPSPVAPPPRQEPSLTPEAIDQRAEEIAAGQDDPGLKAETLLSLGQAQIRRGQRDEGLTTLGRAREAALAIPPGEQSMIPHPIGRIAAALAQAGDREAALETFRESVAVIQALGDRQQSSEWINLIPGWVREIGREGIDEVIEPYLAFASRDQFQRVALVEVRMQATAGEVAAALETTRISPEFQGPGQSQDRLDALVEIARALLPEDGEFIDEILSEARAAAIAMAKPEQGRLSGAGSYALLDIAKVEARLGRFDDALETCRSADLPGPDFVIKDLRFNRAMAFLDIAEEQVASDEHDGARDSINETLQIIEMIEEFSRNAFPRQRAAGLLVKLGELDEAREIIAELEADGLRNSELWRMLAAASKNAGDDEQAQADLIRALRLDREALDASIAQPREEGPASAIDPIISTGNPIVQAATSVARDLLGLGNTEGAIGLVEELPEESRDEFLPELAGVLGRAGELDAAREIIARIDDPELRNRAIYRVALGMPGEAIEEASDEDRDGIEAPEQGAEAPSPELPEEGPGPGR